MKERLAGRTILITRTASQAGSFRALLEEEGAAVIEVPTIEIIPKLTPELDTAIRSLSEYDWLIFTSVNGVDAFCSRLKELGYEKTRWPRVCTIGPATADSVRSHGCNVDLQPTEYRAEGVLEELFSLHGGNLTGLKILLPRAAVAREILPDELREKGAQVDVIPVYETVVPQSSRNILDEVLAQTPPDMVTFTSSSTVTNFISLVDDLRRLRSLKFAVIGPITADTAAKHGLEVCVMPEKYTISDLVEAIADYFTSRR